MKLDHRPRLPRYNVEGVSALPSFKLFGGNNFASWDTRFQHCVRGKGGKMSSRNQCVDVGGNFMETQVVLALTKIFPPTFRHFYTAAATYP